MKLAARGAMPSEMFELRVSTPKEWANIALSDFDAFLLDHAACERKASAVGLSFVVRYPDRTLLMEPMIQFAREELEHFHQCYRLIESRGLVLSGDASDEYVNSILEKVRFGREERFLDRLLASAVIEARGFERLQLVAEALTDDGLKNFYARLARAEAHHRTLFAEMALQFFPEPVVRERLEYFLGIEARAISAAPFRAAIH